MPLDRKGSAVIHGSYQGSMRPSRPHRMISKMCSRCGRARQTSRTFNTDLCRDCYVADPQVWNPAAHPSAC